MDGSGTAPFDIENRKSETRQSTNAPTAPVLDRPLLKQKNRDTARQTALSEAEAHFMPSVTNQPASVDDSPAEVNYSGRN